MAGQCEHYFKQELETVLEGVIRKTHIFLTTIFSPLSDIIEEINKLKVCAINWESISFNDWLTIMTN